MIGSVYLLPAIASALLGAVIAVYLFIRKPMPGWLWAASLSALLALWCASEYFLLQSPTQTAAITYLRIQSIAIALLPVTWVTLCSKLRSFHLGWKEFWLLLVIPLVTLYLAFDYSSAAPNLLWKGVYTSPVGIKVEHGPWFRIFLAYCYVIFAAGWVLLFNLFSQSSHYRSQLFATTGLPLIVIFLNLIHQAGLWPGAMDPTPIGFTLCLAIWGWMVGTHQLLDFTPVSREVAIDSLTDSIFIVDSSGKIFDYNTAASTLVGVKSKLLGKYVTSLIPQLPDFHRVAESTIFEIAPEQYLQLFSSHVQLPDSEQSIFIINLRDVSTAQKNYDMLAEAQEELKRVNEELDGLAHTDELTGLANRRFLLIRLEEEIARARRLGHPLAVLFIDLDHFKRVNDTYGHRIGDNVLRETAAELKQLRKGIDISARYGGEEMILIITGTAEQGVFDVARRLWKAIGNKPHDSGNHTTINVTASMGIALLEETDRANFDIINRADKALYYAKRTGRNRVCIAREGQIETVFTPADQNNPLSPTEELLDEGDGDAPLRCQ